MIIQLSNLKKKKGCSVNTHFMLISAFIQEPTEHFSLTESLSLLSLPLNSIESGQEEGAFYLYETTWFAFLLYMCDYGSYSLK